MTKILQRLSRIVLAVFALILLFVGGMNCQRYLTERHDPKTAVSGQVIKSASTKLVRYQFKSVTYEQVPVGNITQKKLYNEARFAYEKKCNQSFNYIVSSDWVGDINRFSFVLRVLVYPSLESYVRTYNKVKK